MQIPRGWLVCVLALPLAACGGKKSDDKATGSDKVVAPVDNEPLGGVKDGKIVGRTGGDIAMLPVDADLIGGLNIQQLQLGGLWKEFVVPMIMKDPTKLEEFKTKCGFDPLQTIKSASFSLKNIDTSHFPDTVAVVHGIDKAKGLACIATMKKENEKVAVTIDGDYVSFAKDGKTFILTWTNDTTILVEGPKGTKEDLVKFAKGDDTLRSSPQVVDMYGKLNPNDSMWFLLKGSAKIVEQAAAIGLKPVAVFGTVNAGNDLSADLRVRTADPAEAQKAQGTLSALAGQAKNFVPVDKIEAVLDGNDVRVQASITGEHLKQAQTMLKGGGPPPGGAGSAAPTPPATP